MMTRLKQGGLPAHPFFWGAFVAVGDWNRLPEAYPAETVSNRICRIGS